MSENWYYADRRRERHGPMDADALRAAVARGALDDAGLVWREGLAEWVPLSYVRQELGLPPPAPMAAAPVAPAPAPAYSAPPAAPAEPEKKSRGCLIAAIIGGVGLFLVFFLAILAAIAVPAYQDYLGRSKLAAVIAGTGAAKAAVAEFKANTDRCPRDLEELGLAPDSIPGVDELVAGAFEDGTCALELHLGSIEGLSGVEGQRIWMGLEDDGTWTCEGDASLSRKLPATCR